MAKPRLRVKLHRGSAMHVTGVSIGRDKLVYVIVADKKLVYAEGRSRVAYIGTTKTGIARIAGSVAGRAYDILGTRGVRAFDVRIITCRPRQNVKTWRKLERAMLISFKEAYGEPPWWNTKGKRMKERDEFVYFSRARVRRILEDLA